MTTPTYTPIDIVNFAADKDAVGIQTAFDQMVGAKVHAAIQQRKVEIAQSMFVDPDAVAVDQDETEDQQVVSAETEEQEPEESHEDAEQHA